MKIGDKVKCLTSIFLCPYYGDIGVIKEIRENEILIVDFPKLNKTIYMRNYEVEVIE